MVIHDSIGGNIQLNINNLEYNSNIDDVFVNEMLSDHKTPTTYDEAVTGSDEEQWIGAIKKELDDLIAKDTFEYVDKLPSYNIIDTKYVFKLKTNDNGEIIKWKARLCPRGFRQRSGIDYNDKLPSCNI